MSKEALKGKIKLGQHVTDKDDYWIYDDDGLICGSLGINEDKVKDLIKRVNKEVPIETINTIPCDIEFYTIMENDNFLNPNYFRENNSSIVESLRFETLEGATEYFEGLRKDKGFKIVKVACVLKEI